MYYTSMQGLHYSYTELMWKTYDMVISQPYILQTDSKNPTDNN